MVLWKPWEENDVGRVSQWFTCSISDILIVGMVSGTNNPLSVAKPPRTTCSKLIPFCLPRVDLYLTDMSLD